MLEGQTGGINAGAAEHASPRHARTAPAKGELDLTEFICLKPDRSPQRHY
jgi:hypothetical protein